MPYQLSIPSVDAFWSSHGLYFGLTLQYRIMMYITKCFLSLSSHDNMNSDSMLKELSVLADPGCRAQGIAFDTGQVLLLLAFRRFFSAVPRFRDSVLPDNIMIHCSFCTVKLKLSDYLHDR